ncbi:CRISPR-associated endonuclease Cas2 [Candidatus Microgenomates bacterium]|nr:CRISPR-associated endonuclease Cas2 [Candidatus Microgenomates bacterium]
MAKLLRTSDRIILGLAILEDFIEDVLAGGGIPGNAYKTVYGFMPRKYKKSNFRTACWRKLSTKEIEKITINGQPYLRLTGKGKRRLIRYFPLLKLREKKWDGYLRVVIFDIEQMRSALRDRFRRKLKNLGFQMWQRSVWVSLLPIEEELRDFLKNNKLLGRAYLLMDKGRSIENIRDFVWNVWKLDGLEKKYENLFGKYSLENSKDTSIGERQKIKTDFLEILSQDPLLPLSVLPEDWIGEKVKRIIKSL